MTKPMGILTVAVTLVAGCADDTPGTQSECTRTADCQAGFACVDGTCEQVCSVDTHCPDGMICVSDICEEGSRSDAPVIREVDADGTEDADPTHVGHRIQSMLTIRGENFVGAGVQLSDAAETRDLELCGSSADELLVALPADLVSGTTYTLRVSNQEGVCEAALPVLQGEQGPAGSPDSGDDIIGKINGASGTIDAGRLPPIDAATLQGNVAAQFARRNELPALNENPWFDRNLEGWTITSGAGAVAADSTSPSGYSFANTDGSSVWIHGTELTVDPNRTYIVRGRYRNATPGNSDGRIFLAVVLKDAAGDLITGDGIWWYYPAAGVNVATDTWTTFQARFGEYTNRPIPAAAATITVGAILNYHQVSGDNPPGNRVFHVAGLSIEAQGGPDQRMAERISRYVSICAGIGAANNYNHVAAVTPGDSTITNMTGSEVCDQYVGNNGTTNWLCDGVYYVYRNFHTNGFFGTDIRRWNAACDVEYGTDIYAWVDPYRGTGRMMACCHR